MSRARRVLVVGIDGVRLDTLHRVAHPPPRRGGRRRLPG
ncbi:hypothetical protein GA0115255_106111, partial [Streptomyces sp. Ncost-T6T-2b]